MEGHIQISLVPRSECPSNLKSDVNDVIESRGLRIGYKADELALFGFLFCVHREAERGRREGGVLIACGIALSVTVCSLTVWCIS